MIKLFCSDLDGTLLINNRIDEISSESLKDLSNKGVDLCLVSGRIQASIRYLRDSRGLSSYIIANNGAVLMDKNGEVLYDRPLKRDALLSLIEYGERNNLHFHMYDLNSYYSNSLNFKYLRHLLTNDSEDMKFQANILAMKDLSKYIMDNDINIYKVQYVLDKKDVFRVRDDISRIDDINISQSGDNNLEIMDKEVNKWKTISKLMDKLNIDVSEVACVGDHFNDLEMIKNAGFGIAVANARDEVKEVSDYITDSVFNHGVSKAILKIIREKI